MATTKQFLGSLEIRSIDQEQRIIEGIASTPTPDRMGDIVEPLGAKIKLPLPLLWQHDTTQPIGQVTYAQPNAKGIPFKAKIANIDEPGVLKDRLDQAWQSIKAGLINAVSIGFRAIEGQTDSLPGGGKRFKFWDLMELSVVTVPAQPDAVITTIKRDRVPQPVKIILPNDVSQKGKGSVRLKPAKPHTVVRLKPKPEHTVVKLPREHVIVRLGKDGAK